MLFSRQRTECDLVILYSGYSYIIDDIMTVLCDLLGRYIYSVSEVETQVMKTFEVSLISQLHVL